MNAPKIQALKIVRRAALHSRHELRYAPGSPGRVVNMRTFTTQIGFVMMAVAAPV